MCVSLCCDKILITTFVTTNRYAGSTVLFELGNLVSRGGVVVVTINYRLGLLGFTERPDFPRTDVPGNQAIHDTIMALRWVKDHIANFGGDPSRVTVFGESAGAVTIRALLSAPSSWDLYSNVIGQSDPINIPFKPPKDAADLSTYFFEALYCGATDISCARSKPIDEVLIAQSLASDKMLAAQNWTTGSLIERPTVDGALIPAEFSDLVKSGNFNSKANIMGAPPRAKPVGSWRRTYRSHILPTQATTTRSSRAS